MKNTLLGLLFIAGLYGALVINASKPLPVSQSPAPNSLPDSTVYRLTKTSGANAGELDVYCLNGADATIRPVDSFGHIVVSCGK